MSKQTIITCDNCNEDLSSTYAMPKYRLVLSCEKMKNTADFINAVRVYPPIDNEKYFCNMKCLREWCNK